MAAPRSTRPSYRRALLVYLLAIAGPTLVLLVLGLQSVARQRQAIAALNASNLRLLGERLAEEIERRAGEAAEACLQDPKLAGFRSTEATPEAIRRARTQLAELAGRHPIARDFFVVAESAVRFPPLRTPTPRPLEPEGRLATLLAAAESRELRDQRPDAALPLYQQAHELPVSDSWKALTLARMARCWQKMGREAERQQALRRLAGQYGDLYDPFQRPYALVAGLELPAEHQRAAGLARDLVAGRWELSAEQWDYFVVRLGERGSPVPRFPETDYARQLELGRALEGGFRHSGPLRAGQVHASSLSRGQTPYQLYYTGLAGGPAAEALLGFAVDLNWVRQRLLPECRVRAGLPAAVAAGLAAAGQHSAGGAGEARAAFSSQFRFWELTLSQSESAPGVRGAWVFAGVLLLVLCVLVLGVVLLMRDVWRDLEMNRLRSDFVSGVSHELKTPLTLIKMYAETLLDEESFPKGERRGFSEIILRESDRLTHLIEKVLDFSRIERGAKQYHLSDGNLAGLIGRTVEVYGQYLRRRGFRLESRLPADLPPVRFDPDAVSQALVNLLDNAVKYSGDSRFVGVELSQAGGRVILEVEDRGVGIPAGEREKIFQRFYRVEDGAGKGGYGLGLFLVKHIMEAHGGQVELESQVGAGSRFRLVFPVSAAG